MVLSERQVLAARDLAANKNAAIAPSRVRREGSSRILSRYSCVIVAFSSRLIGIKAVRRSHQTAHNRCVLSELHYPKNKCQINLNDLSIPLYTQGELGLRPAEWRKR